MDTELEERLRAYAPVTMARLVAKDCEFGGRRLKEGDWMLLSFPAANRDPAVFEDADRVLLDRVSNRHAAFGLGRHRCLGSNLARLELRVALAECWPATPTSSCPTRPRSAGPAARSAALASCRSASSPAGRPRGPEATLGA
jgi:cytochrome P450